MDKRTFLKCKAQNFEKYLIELSKDDKFSALKELQGNISATLNNMDEFLAFIQFFLLPYWIKGDKGYYFDKDKFINNQDNARQLIMEDLKKKCEPGQEEQLFEKFDSLKIPDEVNQKIIKYFEMFCEIYMYK